MKRAAALATLMVAVAACDTGRPHFEVRGVATKTDATSYGMTRYKLKGTVVATGGHSKDPFIVYYWMKRSGGDPEIPSEGLIGVVMRDGIGEIDEYLSVRGTADTWQSPSVDLRPIGFIAITPFK